MYAVGLLMRTYVVSSRLTSANNLSKPTPAAPESLAFFSFFSFFLLFLLSVFFFFSCFAFGPLRVCARQRRETHRTINDFRLAAPLSRGTPINKFGSGVPVLLRDSNFPQNALGSLVSLTNRPTPRVAGQTRVNTDQITEINIK